MPIKHSLPHAISVRDISILPSKFGILFFIVLLSMLLGSINDGSNLGYLLTFLLTSILITSIFYTYRNILGLKIITIKSNPVFAGETAVFNCLLSPQNLSRYLLEINFKDQVVDKLSRLKNDCAVNVLHRTEVRGILQINNLIISSVFPFGLFRAQAKIKLDLSCLVYPKPLSARLPENYIFESSSRHETVANSKGNDDFNELKQYQSGDSLKHIYWKSLARGQGLMTKTFAGTAGAVLLLNYSELANNDHEDKLSYLCDMCLQASRLQTPFFLELLAGRRIFGKGEVHLHRCLEALALC